MTDIHNYDTFALIEPVLKGWSAEKKYYVQTKKGKEMMLRISDISQYSKKKHEFNMIKRLAELGVPMSQPVDFGICSEGKEVYMLLTWVGGDDAESQLQIVSEKQQYRLGVKSGHILQKIHSVSAPRDQELWEKRFNRKVDSKIDAYNQCPVKTPGGEHFIEYINSNRRLLAGRPQCLHHGDYHVGNMIIGFDGSLSIIDFNRMDFGDPWEEFNRIVWSAQACPQFATGQLNGYFGGKPTEEFWSLLALYISSNTLASVSWAVPFGQAEIDTMQKQAQTVLKWYDNMKNVVPTWYLSELR